MRTARRRSAKNRSGAMYMLVVFLLLVIGMMVVSAVDSGWIALTRAQMHAAADSAALAGGIELLDGLGANKTKTPSEVRAVAIPAAVEFAGRNRAGDRSPADGGCYCDPGRDIFFGKAVYDPDAGAWVKEYGGEPHNFIQVNLLRDQAGSEAGDGQLPLFFSPLFAVPEAPVTAFATAVILPASGFFIEEGSDDTAGLLPFAFRETVWRQFEEAEDYYFGRKNHPNYSAGELQELVNNPPTKDELLSKSALGAVLDPNTGYPLFGETYEKTTGANAGTYFHQLFYNEANLTDGVVSAGTDQHLEVDIYPHREPDPESPGGQGNFGTVDFGNTNNSTQTLVRQIEEGLNADDLSYYEGNQLTIDTDTPLDAEGDTGISGGIESSLESILGDCRAIVLFSASNGGSGNNYVYTLVDIVGAAIVEVELGSGNKRLFIQPCTFVDDNAVGDTDEEIGEDDSVFTPLILIE